MLETLFAGLINGNAYALVALGFSLVIGVANVVNFAHGSLFATGALVGCVVAASGLPLPVAALAAVAVTAALGWVINLIAVKPFAGKAPVAAVLATIAVMIVLDAANQLVFGPQVRPMSTGLPDRAFTLLGIAVSPVDVIILVTTVVLTLTLALFLRITRTGRAIRATSQDREAAAQMGIKVSRVQSVAFMIASGLGGLAGVLVASYLGTISPTAGFTVGLSGMAAATLGGLGSLPGALLGGLLMGVVEAFGVSRWGDSARSVITFGVLLAVLWLRPQGLLGKKAIRKEPLTGTFFAQARPIRVPWWGVLALLVIGILPGIPALVGNAYLVQIAVQVVAFSLLALSLTVLSGQAGQLSLGQAGAAAIGGYAAALLLKHTGLDFLVVAVLSGLIAAAVMTILAAPSWRLSGHYPAIATLATGAAIAAVALIWDPVTGGGAGIAMIPLPTIFGQQVSSLAGMYLVGFGLLVFSIGLVWLWSRSHLGRFWRAIRDDEVAARSTGIATPQYKSLAFGASGFIAGLAGAYWAAQYGYINPSIFNPTLSFQAVTIGVLGGLLHPLGAVLGAVVMVGGLEALRFSPSGRLFIYGLVLLLLVRFRPNGLWSEPAKGWPWQRAKRAAEAADLAASQATHPTITGGGTSAPSAPTSPSDLTSPVEDADSTGSSESALTQEVAR